MPQNKIQDLRNHLFASLERLADKEEEIDLAREEAIAKTAQVIVNSAKLEIDLIKAIGGDKGSSFFVDGNKQIGG